MAFEDSYDQPPKPDPEGYPIDRDNVVRYFFWGQILFIALMGLAIFGVGIILAPVYALTIGTWLPNRQAGALRYWLDGTTLRVDQGVYMLSRRSIPLDQITDITLAQGPVMRRFGIWSLTIQSAGLAGQAVPTAILYGLREPEEVRRELMGVRDQLVQGGSARLHHPETGF